MKDKTTQRRAWTLAATCGLALLTGCATDKNGKTDDPSLPTAQTSQVKATKASATACSKAVVVASSHAVADPCLTTADIAKSLGVSPDQVAKDEKKLKKKKAAHH